MMLKKRNYSIIDPAGNLEITFPFEVRILSVCLFSSCDCLLFALFVCVFDCLFVCLLVGWLVGLFLSFILSFFDCCFVCLLLALLVCFFCWLCWFACVFVSIWGTFWDCSFSSPPSRPFTKLTSVPACEPVRHLRTIQLLGRRLPRLAPSDAKTKPWYSKKHRGVFAAHQK